MNFEPEKLRKFLNCASNPSNPMETKVKNYYVNQEIQEFASFDIDFENVDIALRIAGMLGEIRHEIYDKSFSFP